jgi:hypothetical protein
MNKKKMPRYEKKKKNKNPYARIAKINRDVVMDKVKMKTGLRVIVIDYGGAMCWHPYIPHWLRYRDLSVNCHNRR